MGMLILWVLFSFIVASVFGTARTIGFLPSLLLCLLLSPLIGFIVCLFFETNERKAQRLHSLKLQQEAVNIARQAKPAVNLTPVEELEKLSKLKADNMISEDEYQRMKEKLLS